MKGVYAVWTDIEKAYVLEHYKEMTKPELMKKMQEELGSKLTVVNLKSFFRKHGLTSGIDVRYKKGHVSANKGVKMSPEMYEKSRATMFKKGHKPKNTLKVGSEILHKSSQHNGNDYWYVKIAEPNVWKAKHKIIWEEAYGPIPEGHVLIFLDGNRDNITLENLRLISKNENMRLNQSFSKTELNAEQRNVAVDIVKLNCKIRERSK